MSFGNWEGLRYEDMDRETKNCILPGIEPGSIVPPEGESFDA